MWFLAMIDLLGTGDVIPRSVVHLMQLNRTIFELTMDYGREIFSRKVMRNTTK